MAACCVVVVDDDKSVNELVADVLRGMGHVVIQAYDGVEGIRRVLDHDVDLIITDINMPRVDGISLIEQLRINDIKTQVIIMTVQTDIAYARRAIQLGVCDYLIKPFEDLAELQAAVRRALEKRSRRRRRGVLERELEQRVKRGRGQATQRIDSPAGIAGAALPFLSKVADYAILEELGHGGMGIVYRAEVSGADLPQLALKVMLPENLGNQNAVERFMNESRIAMRLDHPHIVETFDAGRDGDYLYLAMELLNGQTAGQRVRRYGVMDEQSVVTLALEILDAVEHLWDIGLLHRDIKPDNIIIQEDASSKLTDLGLAKDLNSDYSLSQSGMLIGTPDYLAPELVLNQGQDPDVRADLYALGATLYYLCTRRTTHDAKGLSRLLAARQQSDPEPVCTINPLISESCGAVIARMLARNVNERYPDCASLRRDLLALL